MERHYLGHGVAIQRRGRTWAVDVYWKGRRMVRSLGTTDEDVAREIGYRHVNEIKRHQLQIEQDICVLDNASKGMPSFFLDPSDPRCKEVPTMGSDQIQRMAREAVAAGLERLKNRALSGVDMGATVREAMTQVLSAQKPAITEKPLDDLVTEYVTVVKGTQNIEKDWEKNIKTQLHLFFAWAKIKTLTEVERSHVEGYIAQVRTVEGRGDWSVRQKFFILAKFFKWAVARRYLSTNPSEGIAIKKPGKRKIDFFLASECKALIKNAVDEERAAVIALAIYGGLRRDEIFTLDRRDINLEDRLVELDETKTDYPRTVPILDQLLPHLKKLPLKPGRIFTAWGHEDTMGSEMTAYAKKITKRTGKWIGLQMMRRSFSTYVMANGVAADTESRWAGHGVKVAEDHYRGLRPLGERPLLMTFRGARLERHGVTERLARTK